jgi:hypothetical protein
VHRRAIDGALEQILNGNDAVLVVDMDAPEHLVLALSQPQAQIRLSLLGTLKSLALLVLGRQDP